MPEHLIDRALLEPVGAGGRFERQAEHVPRVGLRRRLDPVSGRGRPLPPVRLVGLPVGAPHDHRAAAEGPRGRRSACRSSTRSATRSGWAFTGGEYIDPVNGFRFLGEAYAATDPDHKRAPQRAGAVGHGDQADRQQRVGRRPADVHDGVRRPRHARRRPLARARTARRSTRSTTRLYEDVNNAVYGPASRRDQDDYERGRRAHVRDARRDGRAPGRLAVPVRRRPGRDRLAAVHDARCASTPSTTSTSSAACAGSSTTRTSGRTRATSTRRPASPETVRFDDIRRHYYMTHGSMNPSRIVAVRPDEDWDEPHGRG